MTNGVSCNRSIISGALVTAKEHRLLAAVDHTVTGVERDGEQAALLPLEMHLTLLFAGGPKFGGADALDNVNQFFVEMVLRIESGAGRNLADVHSGETFHPFQDR